MTNQTMPKKERDDKAGIKMRENILQKEKKQVNNLFLGSIVNFAVIKFAVIFFFFKIKLNLFFVSGSVYFSDMVVAIFSAPIYQTSDFVIVTGLQNTS